MNEPKPYVSAGGHHFHWYYGTFCHGYGSSGAYLSKDVFDRLDGHIGVNLKNVGWGCKWYASEADAQAALKRARNALIDDLEPGGLMACNPILLKKPYHNQSVALFEWYTGSRGVTEIRSNDVEKATINKQLFEELQGYVSYAPGPQGFQCKGYASEADALRELMGADQRLMNKHGANYGTKTPDPKGCGSEPPPQPKEQRPQGWDEHLLGNAQKLLKSLKGNLAEDKAFTMAMEVIKNTNHGVDDVSSDEQLLRDEACRILRVILSKAAQAAEDAAKPNS